MSFGPTWQRLLRRQPIVARDLRQALRTGRTIFLLVVLAVLLGLLILGIGSAFGMGKAPPNFGAVLFRDLLLPRLLRGRHHRSGAGSRRPVVRKGRPYVGSADPDGGGRTRHRGRQVQSRRVRRRRLPRDDHARFAPQPASRGGDRGRGDPRIRLARDHRGRRRRLRHLGWSVGQRRRGGHAHRPRVRPGRSTVLYFAVGLGFSFLAHAT